MKKVEIDLELLKRISHYYDFPLAVFFTQKEAFPPKKTRDEIILEKAKKFDKIIEFIENLKEENEEI